MAKLQVLWPLMCCFQASGSVYGFGAARAESLGLDRKEMLRWWHEYKCSGVAGVIPSGVQARWKQWLPELENRLSAERQSWRQAGNDTFDRALMGELRCAEQGQYLPVSQEAMRVWQDLRSEEEAAQGIRPHQGHGSEQAQKIAERIGICREILLEPIVSRRYTDRAINAYAEDWATSGPTMRLWLDWYKPELGWKSVVPSRLTEGQINWLKSVEAAVKALRESDGRPRCWYWNDLVGTSVRPMASGVASRRLEGAEARDAKTRYEAVTRRLVEYLAATNRRRNNNQAGIAKALGVSEQTITNWKNKFAAGESLAPQTITEAMAAKIATMEEVVARLVAGGEGTPGATA